jgi:hypothetical protein
MFEVFAATRLNRVVFLSRVRWSKPIPAAASRVYDAFADLYERLAADYQGSGVEIGLIKTFLSEAQ